MGKKKTLGAVLLASGDILGKVIGFLMLPYLTAKLGVVGFGELTLYVSFIQILVIVVSLSGHGLLPVKFVHEGRRAALELKSNNAFISMIIGGVIFVGYMVFCEATGVGFGVAVGALVVLSATLQALNALSISYFRISQSYRAASVGQFFVVIFNVAFTVIIFEAFTAGAEQRLLAVCLSLFVIQAFYFFIIDSGESNFDVNALKTNAAELARYGASLFPHHASFWLRSSVDRYFIAYFIGMGTAGVYGLAFQLSSMIILFFGVVSQALQPFIYRELKEGRIRRVAKMQSIYVAAVIFSVVSAILILPLIFPYFFDEKFNEALEYFRVLALGAAFHCIYLGFSHQIFYMKRTGLVSLITFSGMLAHLLMLGLVMFIEHSVLVFCWVYACSSGVAMLMAVYYSWKISKEIGAEVGRA